MQINLNKSTFRDHFLYPVSKVVGDDASNKGCIINVTKTDINCLCNSVDGSIILHAKLACTNDSETSLNIFDIRKLIKVLDCIPTEDVSFDVSSNNIAYNTPSLKFKFYLMDDGIIRKSAINPEKINSLKFDTEFMLTADKLNSINRLSTFTEDTNKIYISSIDDKVVAELTDKTKPNIDTASTVMADNFTGSVIPQTVLSLDVLRKFAGIKFDMINVKVNTTTKIFSFELSSNECSLKYISTALIK